MNKSRRRASLVNDMENNQQENNRLAQALQKLDKEKQKVGKEMGKLEKEKMLTRRKSEASLLNTNATLGAVVRRPSLSDIVMQRRLSKHDQLTGTSSDNNDLPPADVAETKASQTDVNAKPYSNLLDKERFDKFLNATRKLSVPDVGATHEEEGEGAMDNTDHGGDMNMYLRLNNDDKTREKLYGEEIVEGNIKWDCYNHTAPKDDS